MDFVAIDFETANGSRASVCQAGVAVVRGGKIQTVDEWLIQPPTGPDNFHPINIGIHGVTPERAALGMSWAESAQRLHELIGGLPVVAHNAVFDRDVYWSSCEQTGIESAEWDWYCSLQLARLTLPLPAHKLSDVATHLRIDLGDHHQAGSDARVAAEIAIAIGQQQGEFGLQSMLPCLPRQPKRRRQVSPMRPPVTSTPTHTRSRYNRVGDLPTPNLGADSSHALFGEHVVITGDLGGLSRDAAFEKLAEVGAQPQLNLTKQTTILVVGSDAGDRKIEDSKERGLKGQSIRFMEADHFLFALEGRAKDEGQPTTLTGSGHSGGAVDLSKKATREQLQAVGLDVAAHRGSASTAGSPYPLPAPPAPSGPPKSHVAAILLSLFLGTLGIDRFYLGHVGLGITKLLLSWLTFGIWQVIDLVLIICKGTLALKRVNWT